MDVDRLMPVADVPCGGCRLCCRHVFIPLLPGADDPSKYRTVEFGKGYRRLETKPGTSECVYLGDNGCEIYADRPHLCQAFDCRGIAEMYPTYTKARKSHYSIVIWKRGRELLREQR